ncbi:RNA polymerase sigma factor [Gluconacetobacter sp. Hr-1-5]|uniref:RNA polymerase sigma factor n=1 Tax=Gluconacetobacter sp. Hr-1-5 TaxID=3395370 RepID=UPI003B520D30
MSSNVSILNKIFASERSALARFFQKIGTTASSDDLLQTLWLRIQRVAETPPIHNGKAYLFRLASNLAIDQGRVDVRIQRLQGEARSILYGDDTTILDAEQTFLAREELERVIAAARSLPEPTRTVFWLNRIKDMPMGDVARTMGVSRTTVEKHIKRALAQLGDARDG